MQINLINNIKSVGEMRTEKFETFPYCSFPVFFLENALPRFFHGKFP